MPELQIRDIPLGDTPIRRVTKGSEHMTMLVVDATYNGSGATEEFVPAVQVISSAGEEVGTFITSETVAAGDSARVTFAPFLRSERAAGFHVGFYEALPPGGNPVPAGTNDVWLQLTFAGGSAGEDLLDVVNAAIFSSWTPKVAGLYCYMARIAFEEGAFAPWPAGEFVTLDLTPIGADPPPANSWATQATTTWELTSSAGGPIYTIYALRYMSPGDAAVGAEYGLRCRWSYAGAVRVSGFVEAIRIL